MDTPLQTPYVSRPHLIWLDLAQCRITFRPEHTKRFSLKAATLDLSHMGYNALHFGGHFQQYLVDTFIRVKRDRILQIKLKQKTSLADNYVGVTRLGRETEFRCLRKKIIQPSSFTAFHWINTLLH